MTSEQEVSMVNSLEKIANALQENPVKKYLEMKVYEEQLIKSYGPDLVKRWKEEYLLQDQAKQYVEREAKIYKEKYVATTRLLTDIMTECEVAPRRYATSNGQFNIEKALADYKETIDRISSQFDATP